MIEQLLNVGGQQLLLPVLIALGGLYAARGLFGLHSRMGQRRRDFIELWSPERAEDDLWLQVVVRHLFGCYLPAPVIRKVMGWPDAAASLLAIAEIWPMLTLDPETEAVSWKRKRYENPLLMRAERFLVFSAYVAMASVAVLAGFTSFRSAALSLPAISYALTALALGGVSLVLLTRDDSLEAAYKRGPDLLARLNSPGTPAAAAPSSKHDGHSVEASPA